VGLAVVIIARAAGPGAILRWRGFAMKVIAFNGGPRKKMNVNEEQARANGYSQQLALGENYLKRVFGAAESLYSYDTLQFHDYSKMVADRFDEAAKRRVHAEVFPQDCQKAFELGVRLAGGEA
jgi:hypothetical protein